MTIKVYDVTMVSEAMITVRLDAESPEQADEAAADIARQILDGIKGIYFGDIVHHIGATEVTEDDNES